MLNEKFYWVISLNRIVHEDGKNAAQAHEETSGTHGGKVYI